MRHRIRVSGSFVRIAAGLAALGAILFASTAIAAGPVIDNGGFEAGDVSGWKLSDSVSGSWIAYQGHPVEEPKRGSFGPFPKPPRGHWAVWSAQNNPSTMILSQTFPVPKDATLKFFTYYQAYAPFATPLDLNGDTDDPMSHPNEQYRVDLMKPNAPIRSVDDADVLKTLFRTKHSSPDELRPTKITTSLAKFAGEKVRLRFAVSVNEDVLNAGLDGVKIVSAH